MIVQDGKLLLTHETVLIKLSFWALRKKTEFVAALKGGLDELF